MRIFYAFLVVFVAAILFMLPITAAVYDFRTDLKEDSIFFQAGAGVTGANVTLIKPLYNNDIATVSVLSDEQADTPVVTSYTSATRVLLVNGLAASTNRTLEVSYDYDALNGSPAVNILVDRIAWIWLLVVIGIAPAALASMFIGRG